METKRATVKRAERILGKTIKCLDYGFIRLVDYMGDDRAIVQAARVSYGKGTKKISTDKALIDYLMRHRHTTPFEMVEFKFHARMPIFVARQWVRHRTANINEISGRYSVLDCRFYKPSPKMIALQSKTNRQGRDSLPAPRHIQKKFLDYLKQMESQAYNYYENLIDEGVARELARIGLPLNLYTEWYWKIDLHNLFHFLSLRLDPHAQYEIRVYAKALARLAKTVCPWAWSSFEEHILEGVNFSRKENQILKAMILNQKVATEGLSPMRLRELGEKLKKIGLPLSRLGFLNEKK